MRLTPDEEKAIRELAGQLRHEFGAKQVVLYGSAARGDMDEGSDIDLFVVIPEYSWEVEKRISNACFDVDLEIGRVVCPVLISEHEIENSPLRASPLVAAVADEGVRL